MSVNLPRLLARGMVKYGRPIGVRSATLTKFTPGTRDPANITGGTRPTSTPYPCNGAIQDYEESEIDGAQIVQGDRKITLYGATIANGTVSPSPGDQITITDSTGTTTTYTIVDKGVSADGVGAVYRCQVRR